MLLRVLSIIGLWVLCVGSSALAKADSYQLLYQAAGWPEQRANFQHALELAQQRYKSSLPTLMYEALVANSNQRFDATAIDQRALLALRQQLPNPETALSFYQSPLGRKIVAAEVSASSPEQLASAYYAQGLPEVQTGSTRQLLIRSLAQSIPVTALSAEVSLALASVAADSLTQMLPGLGMSNQALTMVENQRQRLVNRFEPDVDDWLLRIYQTLSDAELDEYLMFVQSPQGQAYYQAALQAVRAGLAVGQDGSSLSQSGAVKP